MFRIMKKAGSQLYAYRLGDPHPVLEELIEKGLVRPAGDGSYEIFSSEAVHGKGEAAVLGDYVKLDSNGIPYPNSAEFFQKNHRHLSGDLYEQISRSLLAWDINEPMCQEINFLIQKKGLKIDDANPECYFSAPLWGTKLSAQKDAVIVFYSIDRSEDGQIKDINFNFVSRTEFELVYMILE